MSILKRLSTTLISRFDQVVTGIENHDAVIQASLDEMSNKIAKAKIALNRACRERDRLKTEIEPQLNNVQRWRERAVSCAQSDEAKALECLRRSHCCENQAAAMQKTLDEYERSIETMIVKIKSSEQHLAEMKQKLTLMRARQATSNVNSTLSTTNPPNGDVEKMLDETFTRWEMNIHHDDIITLECPDTMDAMEREFITQEQQNDLRNELSALLAKEEQQ
ncbi:MAG: PspA/IM30 family protein [Nitrosomonas sp.]|nr:PspA/IM30 family protein [Nitrosomonas sp.]